MMRQANTVDMTRRSPSYEIRLAEYSTRGFEVYVPTLERDRVDPTVNCFTFLAKRYLTNTYFRFMSGLFPASKAWLGFSSWKNFTILARAIGLSTRVARCGDARGHFIDSTNATGNTKAI